MPDSRTARHRRDRIDRAIELASGLTAAGMFAYGVALSYQVLHAIAAGLPPWAAGCGRWASRRSWPHGSAAYKLEARAEGLALAWGHRWPEPEHFLLAMVYADDGVAARLHHLGASQPAVLEALRRRGVRVPEVEPPAYRPWRGEHRVEVDQAELQPLIDLLIRQHPPGSEWRWGFNWLPGEPRRARVDAEEGIELGEVLAQARRRAGA
jgi:hypothetical protein